MSSSVDRKLKELNGSNYPFIFKVHERLRRQNEDAYEPELISIGPFHYGKMKLKMMQTYKLKYLQGILKRRGEKSAERYIDAIREVEKDARDCYAEYICMCSDDFVEMMLLDGCFIIEFLRKVSGNVENMDNDLIFKIEWYRLVLCRDFLLCENQIPFFILELLFGMTKIENHPHDELISLSISCLPPFFKAKPSAATNQPLDTTFHLLSLMHESWCSSFLKATDTVLHCGKEQENQDRKNLEFIRSASELKKFGIRFEKAKESTSWLDIKFENGIIKIPTLKVDDATESILKNLIAYEHYVAVTAGHYIPRKVVIDYTIFIDCLIDSSKDVQILCDNKIIKNLTGGEELKNSTSRTFCQQWRLQRRRLTTTPTMKTSLFQ